MLKISYYDNICLTRQITLILGVHMATPVKGVEVRDRDGHLRIRTHGMEKGDKKIKDVTKQPDGSWK